MSEQSDTIRKWLLQKPRADVVRVVNSEGESEDIATTGNVRWRSIAETIDALEPMRVEAVAGGKLLRALKLKSAPEIEIEQPKKAAGSNIEIPNILHEDPETARLMHFADLLFRSQMFATEVAFEKLTQLVDLILQRMATVEAKLDRTEQDYQDEVDGRIQDAYDNIAKEGDSSKTDILSSFLGGMGMNQPKTPTKPNGTS